MTHPATETEQPLAPYRPGEDAIRLGGARTAVFTDLHLDPIAPDEIHAFAISLLPLAGGCDQLVILGDLFESYVGREDFLHPAFGPMLQAFEHLRQSGTEIVLIRGNRDVLLSRGDGQHLNLTIADAVRVPGIEGDVLLTHGDAFCLADLPYQRLRRILRFPGMRPLLRALPHGLRCRLAQRLRNHSKQEVARKPLDSMSLTLGQVDQVMLKEGVQTAWIGHLHAAASHDLTGGGHLRVLPAWEPGTAALWIQDSLDETA